MCFCFSFFNQSAAHSVKLCWTSTYLYLTLNLQLSPFVHFFRFLYLLPYTHERTCEVIEMMLRLRRAKNLDLRLQVNFYFLLSLFIMVIHWIVQFFYVFIGWLFWFFLSCVQFIFISISTSIFTNLNFISLCAFAFLVSINL